jgi:hypothetical protein
VSDVPFDEIESKAVTVIEALTPDTLRGGQDRFRQWRGPSDIQEYAEPGDDRRFQLFGTPGSMDPGKTHAPGILEKVGVVSVLIVYRDLKGNRTETRQRIHEDISLIVNAFHQTVNWVNTATAETVIMRAIAESDIDSETGEDRKVVYAMIPFEVRWLDKR